MKTKSIGFIGGGRITKIFLQAFTNKSIHFPSILVYDTDTEVMSNLKNQFPEIKLTDSANSVAKQNIVFIALHPPVIMQTLDSIKESVSGDTILISLAPKISIEKIASLLQTKNIARMIPNATSFINEGYNPIHFSTSMNNNSKGIILEIVKVLGRTFEVIESKLEAYALISAMLPTYFWFQWNELQKIGIEMGLEEKETNDAISESLIAANHLYFNSNLNSSEVIDLIPVKPISEYEDQIKDCLKTKLIPLFNKIKP